MKGDAALKTLVAMASLLVIVVAAQGAGGFFLPLLTALFFAVISTPIVSLLEKRAHFPPVVAIIVTLLLDVGVLAGFIALIITSLEGLEDAFPRYQAAFGVLLHDVEATLQNWGVESSEEIVADLRENRAMNLAGTLVGEAAQALSNFVMVALLLAFLMFEVRAGREKLSLLLGQASPHIFRLAAAAVEVQRYLVIKTILSALTGVITGCWLAVCGVDFPLLWGLLTFLLNYVPSLGPAISFVPPLFIALLTQGPGGAALAASGHLGIGFFIGNVVEPRMMGQTLGLSTLVVFVSMFFWGWMWGPVGALFAVPLTMVIRSAFEAFEGTRWAAVLLGSSTWVERKRREWGWQTAEERSVGLPPPPPIEEPVAK